MLDGQGHTLRLAGGAGVSFVGKIAGRVIQVVAQILFARYLGMADFGRLSLGLTVLRILGLIAPLGLHRAAVVFGSRYWKIDDARFRGVVLTTLGLALTSGIAFGGGLFALAPWLSEQAFRSGVPPELLRTIALAVPFAVLLRVGVELARVSQRMELATLAEDAAQPAVALLLFLTLAPASQELFGAANATVFGYIVASAFAMVSLLVLFPGLRRARSTVDWNLSEILAFTGPTSLAILCGAFTSMLDRLVVGRYCPPEQMAVYQAAGQVSVAFTIIIGSFTTIFAPMAARFLATGDQVALQGVFRTSTRWGLYLGLPLFVFVAVAPGSILGLTFGGSYEEGATVLLILATGQILNVATGNVGILLVTAGAQTSWLALTFAATVVNGLVGVLLVPASGVVGAAIGNLLATVVLYGGATILVWRRLGLWAYDGGFLKIVVSGVVAYGAGAATAAMVEDWPQIVELVVIGLVLGGSFLVSTLALGIDREDRLLAGAVLRRFSGGRA